MKRIIGFIGAGVIAAIAAPTAVQAQGKGHPDGTGLPLVITISASATVQAQDSSNDNGKTTTFTSKVTSFKFTQADIIQTVEEANLGTPTKNAQLIITPVAIQVIDGTNTYDASHFVTLTFDPNANGIWVGTDSTNDVTGDEIQKYVGRYIVGFDFTPGNGDFVSVGGLATETYSIGAPGKSGGKPASDSVSVTFAGEGKRNGAKGVLTGTLKATAKGTIFP